MRTENSMNRSTSKRIVVRRSQSGRKSRPLSSVSFPHDLETSIIVDDQRNEEAENLNWDTDLENDELDGKYDHSSEAAYVEVSKKNNVIPASYFLRHMHDVHLDMKHHGLGPIAVKPLAISLVSNTQVLVLDLSDNWLGPTGGEAVCEMLKENIYITDVLLADNHLDVQFAKQLVDVLQGNATIKKLNLSGNDFDDRAAVYLAEAITNTTRIEYLNLSHNHLCEESGIVLGPAISENSSIKELDLSWNTLRRKGAKGIATGLKTNILLQKLDLSWNGFGTEGALALGDALKANNVLEELDVSNNRLTAEAAVLIGKGLSVNETLKILKIGQNPMQSAGCYAICASMLKNPNTALEILDFENILVNKDFDEVFKKVQEQLNKTIVLKHGGDPIPKKPKARVHPMVKLRNYIEKNNLRLVDFFNKFDKDHSMSVTREEFTEGLEKLCQETGIRLTDDEVTQLLDELDKDGDGEINYSELVMGHQDFTEKEKRISTSVSLMMKSHTTL